MRSKEAPVVMAGDLAMILRFSAPWFLRLFTFLERMHLTKIQPFKKIILNGSCLNAIGNESGTLLWANGIYSQKESASQVKKRIVQVVRLKKISEELREKIANYLERNEHSGPAIDLVILKSLTDVDFFDNPTEFPKYKKYAGEEWGAAWNELIQSCEPGDIFFTFDRGNFINRIIAKIDKGIWAHTGMILNGRGDICEVTPRGFLKGNIVQYRNQKVRIGLYRSRIFNKKITENDMEEMYKKYKRTFLAYGFHVALIMGIKRIFDIRGKKANLYKDVSPNDLIRSGSLILKNYVW